MNTNEGEIIIVALDGDVLFTVSIEDACLYNYSNSIDWILESRASHHVTPCKTNFVSYETCDYGIVCLGNNHFCNIVGVRDVWIQKKDGNDILLKQVRHDP